MMREIISTIVDVVRCGDVREHVRALLSVLVGVVRSDDRCDYVPSR